jgi:hypothetical protein
MKVKFSPVRKISQSHEDVRQLFSHSLSFSQKELVKVASDRAVLIGITELSLIGALTGRRRDGCHPKQKAGRRWKFHKLN